MIYAVIYVMSLAVCLYAGYKDAEDGCIRNGYEYLFAVGTSFIPVINSLVAVLYIAVIYLNWRDLKRYESENSNG